MKCSGLGELRECLCSQRTPIVVCWYQVTVAFFPPQWNGRNSFKNSFSVSPNPLWHTLIAALFLPFPEEPRPEDSTSIRWFCYIIISKIHDSNQCWPRVFWFLFFSESLNRVYHKDVREKALIKAQWKNKTNKTLLERLQRLRLKTMEAL